MPKRVETLVLHDSATPVFGDIQKGGSVVLANSQTLQFRWEVFNVFNATNILGVSVRNYSGYSNVLVRDSSDPAQPGYLRSSSFGQPVTTAGGVFGSGGPRALQLALRTTF